MFLSVVICTYNRDAHIRRALQSLTEQDFDKSAYEIIVVDNNSTDKTPEIIKAFKDEHPEHQIVWAKETQQGLSYARNKGIALAKGQYISYIDDDGIARPDYVSQIKKYTEQFPEIMAFGGKVLPTYETGQEPDWMTPYIERIISIVDLGDQPKILTKTYPVGCNMFFKKTLFDTIGGFNTALKLRSDDKYIFLKVREAGYPVYYAPGVVVWHYIDAFRTTAEYVKKISRLNGEAEYIRITSLPGKQTFKLVLRFVDYLFKMAAALVLWIGYAFKGQAVKGKTLFLAMWYATRGFLATSKK